MATKKVLRRPPIKRPIPAWLRGRTPSAYNPVTGLPIGTPPPPPPKKPKVAKVVIEPTELHRDIVGRPLQVGQYVMAVDNNRIIICRIHHLTPRRVAVVPALEHKRSFASPKQKIYNKECFNVCLIPEEEWFMFKLGGET
jgi:hypothetical protein